MIIIMIDNNINDNIIIIMFMLSMLMFIVNINSILTT